MIESAYLHVPFCHSICAYCAFERSANLKQIDAWLDVICDEVQTTLDQAKQNDPNFKLKTIYFGGGTPSVLSCTQLSRLASLFSDVFDSSGEWTIEANPESITLEWLQTARSLGINRISIGIQTFDENRLKTLNRHHTPLQAKEAVALCRQVGFESISVDLIYGFAKQTMADLNADLDAFLELDIDHLSIYSLILEPDSALGKRNYVPLDEESNALMYEQIEKRLIQAGFEHYEVSSFARNKKYGLHNSLIWDDGQYFGFGFGAIGRDDHGLYHHSGTLRQYIQKQSKIEYEENANPWFDAIMTGLRTQVGLNIQKWNLRYGFDFKKRYFDVLEKYEQYFVEQNERISLTKQGMEILDTILVEFLMED
ncbi:MAG: radical SAM family heme chaperone HemW [Erysipelotrichaceae bacterium]|nr:radical SAM family heme chaperone HemW [Erysipelotrichaceae bacterium]